MARPVQWTPELVSRFWETLAMESFLTRFSFARSAAPILVRLMMPYLRRDGDHLDYGGGDGYLCQYLVEQGYRCGVYEPNKAGVGDLNSRLGTDDRFLGVFSTIEDERFDGVFCLEVIEHVLEQDLDEFLKELKRIIKPGGAVFVTCPNDEVLKDNSVVCPVCDSVFHRWQHVRSLRLPEVVSMLDRVDLETEWASLIGFEAVDTIEYWCDCRDQGRRYVDRNLSRLDRLKARFFSDGTKRGDDGIDLRIGSENNIVLVARRPS